MRKLEILNLSCIIIYFSLVVDSTLNTVSCREQDSWKTLQEENIFSNFLPLLLWILVLMVFNISQTIRNFTPTARYLLQIHSILVTHCKITRYLLQKWLFVKNESLLVATFTSYCCRRNVTFSKLWPLLIEEIARCKRSLATSCEIPLCLLQKILIVKNHSLLVAWNFYKNRNNK